MGFDATIVNGKLFEICEDAERKFGRPSVTTQLVGWMRVGLDIDGWLLRLQKEFPRTTDSKAIIRGFGRPADFDRVFMNDVFVRFRVAADVFHVPTQRFEHGVDKFLTKLRFVILARLVGFSLLFEAVNQISDY